MNRAQVEKQLRLGRPVHQQDLAGLDLSGLSLSGAVFSQCDIRLDRATFSGCCLAGWDLAGRHIAQASFDSCDLSGSDWRGASLNTGFWIQCDLRGARLQGIRLERLVALAPRVVYPAHGPADSRGA